MSVSVFFTGATGYIGGTVLAKTLSHFRLKNLDANVRVLVRTQAKEEKLVAWAKSRGFENLITPVIGSMECKETIISEVSRAKIIIDTADIEHLDGQKFLVEGLEQAIKKGAHPVYIHTSGTDVLIDDANGLRTTDKIYRDDNDDDINSVPDTAPHRDVDLLLSKFLRQHANDLDLAIIAPPTIWGVGAGPDNVISVQVPRLSKLPLSKSRLIMWALARTIGTRLTFSILPTCTC
jgi:hypothetical protein